MELKDLPPADLRAKLDEIDTYQRCNGSVAPFGPQLFVLARKLLDEREAGIIRFEEDERIVQVHRGNGVWQRFVSKDQYNSVRAERDAAVAERDALAAKLESLGRAMIQPTEVEERYTSLADAKAGHWRIVDELRKAVAP